MLANADIPMALETKQVKKKHILLAQNAYVFTEKLLIELIKLHNK